MRVSLAPSGSGSKKAFRLHNKGDKPEAVQISMVVREMDIDGKEKYPDADKDFIVYPTQIILMPGSTKTVRIQWIGDPNPEKELAYRIIAEKLPIDFEEEKSGAAIKEQKAKITLLLRYMGSVYIVPKNAKPDVIVDSVEKRRGENGKKELVVIVHNRGTAHIIMKQLKLRLTSGGSGKNSIVLDSEQLKGMEGENILAGHKRRFILPWPEGLGDGSIKASIDYKKIR
jgi:fimbrial chaperone protein